MSGLSRCCVPMNAPVAVSKTRNSNDGALSAKPGVPGSGGRPMPGGVHSVSVGSSRGWMQVQPAADSWDGDTPCAFAVTVVAAAAPSAAIKTTSTVKWRFMTSPLVSREVASNAAIEAPGGTGAFGDHPEIGAARGETLSRGEASARRPDPQHAPVVVVDPDRVETDTETDGRPADVEPRDQPAGVRVDPVEIARVD